MSFIKEGVILTIINISAVAFCFRRTTEWLKQNYKLLKAIFSFSKSVWKDFQCFRIQGECRNPVTKTDAHTSAST